jgi:hypothetical protein
VIEGIRDSGSEERSAVVQCSVHSRDAHSGRVVERSAKWVKQPATPTVQCPTSPGFLADNHILRARLAQDREHGVLCLDIGTRRKVACALVDTFEGCPKATANDGRSSFNHRDGYFSVGHCLPVRFSVRLTGTLSGRGEHREPRSAAADSSTVPARISHGRWKTSSKK